MGGHLIYDPFLSFGYTLLGYLPGLVYAFFVLLIGYIVGNLVGIIVKKGLDRTKLEKWLEKTGRLDALGGLNPPKLLGTLVKWWVFIAFLVPAANLIKLEVLASLLMGLAQWLPHLLVGIVIMIVGLIVADYAADSISAAKKLKGIRIISPFVRVLLIIYFLTIALEEIGVRVILAEGTLLLIIGGIVLAIALAVGIGFGFGIRKYAEKIIAHLEKRL